MGNYRGIVGQDRGQVRCGWVRDFKTWCCAALPPSKKRFSIVFRSLSRGFGPSHLPCRPWSRTRTWPRICSRMPSIAPRKPWRSTTLRCLELGGWRLQTDILQRKIHGSRKVQKWSKSCTVYGYVSWLEQRTCVVSNYILTCLVVWNIFYCPMYWE